MASGSGSSSASASGVGAKRQRSNSSWVLDHFDEKGDGKTCCKLCKQTYQSTTSTSSLATHLSTKHHLVKGPSAAGDGSVFAKMAKVSAADAKEELNLAVASWVAKNMRPDSVTKDDGLQLVVDKLCAAKLLDYQLPKKTALRTCFAKLQAQISETIQTALKSIDKIAFTTDSWTARNGDRFIAFTVHWIDISFQHKHMCMGVHPICESQTGVAIAAAFTDLANKWEINPSSVLAVVTDGGANFVNMSNKQLAKDGWHVKAVRCAAHLLNGAVKKALEAHADALMKKASALVTAFKRSSSLRDELDRQQPDSLRKLKQLNDTRWTSAFQMLERLLELKVFIQKALVGHDWKKQEPPTLSDKEWEDVSSLVLVLRPAAKVSNHIQADNYTTISTVGPLMVKLNRTFNQFNDDHSLKGTAAHNVSMHLSEQLSDHWNPTKPNIFVLCCCVLDPRFRTLKQLGVSPAVIADVWAEVQFVFDAFKAKAIAELKQNASVGIPAASASASASASAAAASPVVVSKSVLAEIGVECDTAQTVLAFGDEVSSYRFSLMTNVNIDTQPLHWWQQHHERFPVLSRVARAYLCVPSTSAAAERVFSAAGNIVSARRSRLKPENVSQSVFLAYNHKLF